MAARPAPLAYSAASATASPCSDCGHRAATVKVNSSGMPTDAHLCLLCYERACAREWRADVWTRQMK